MFLVLKDRYPDLEKTFSSLYAPIEKDLELRNIATHQTFLFFCLASGPELRDIQEVRSMLDRFEPESEAGMAINRTIRLAMRTFVTEQTDRIQDISKSGLKFAHQCQNAIKSKSW